MKYPKWPLRFHKLRNDTFRLMNELYPYEETSESLDLRMQIIAIFENKSRSKKTLFLSVRPLILKYINVAPFLACSLDWVANIKPSIKKLCDDEHWDEYLVENTNKEQ